MAETWDNMRDDLNEICPTNWNAIDFDTEVVGQLLECRDVIGEERYVELVERLDNADSSTKLATVFEVLRTVGKTMELHPSHPEIERVQLSVRYNGKTRISNEDQSRIDAMKLLIQIACLLSIYRSKTGDEKAGELLDKLVKHKGPQLRNVFDALDLVEQKLIIVPVKTNIQDEAEIKKTENLQKVLA